MLENALKVLLTSVLAVGIAEASKRSALLGALLASLPLTSLLAIGWLWADTRDNEKIAALTQGIFWLVLPSLVFFLALPVLLRRGMAFAPSMALSIALTAAAYFLMLAALKRFGIAV